MNSWGNDYGMPNQYGMPPMSIMPNMMPNMVQPLVPPLCMMSEMGHPNPAPTPGPMIGPVIPVDNTSMNSNDVEIMEDVSEQKNERSTEATSQEKKNEQTKSNTSRDNSRRDRNNDRGNTDRSRRRSRSRDRDRYPRTDRNRDQDRSDNRNSNRNDRRRDRPSKWSKGDDNPVPQINNMQMMPGMMPMMVNNNMMNPGMNHGMMGQQPMMEMGNMQNMGNMPNMMPGMNMMNMMPNMMGDPNMMRDPNMMMMNQQQINQPIYFSSGVLLPPLPGTSMPNRREKPLGCRTIFVGGLPNIINEDVVTEIFQRFGPITNVRLHRQGVCHVRFDNQQSVEQSFMVSGFRFKLHDQTENEATTIFVDYALNRDDQNDHERNKRHREVTPPRIEPFNPNTLNSISEKIKSDENFSEVAPTLHGWLERGECNKKYANTFYSLIQAANNQVRRLFNDKMQIDEEFQTVKNSVKDKYLKIITQFLWTSKASYRIKILEESIRTEAEEKHDPDLVFATECMDPVEQVAKILTAAKHQRVSDHFTKQQRRNIEMWLKMTEEVDNIKEEYNIYFEEEETETKVGKNAVPLEKYEELKTQNENLMYELEGYRNEAHLAKDEAERKFEKFKAQFIAQQALQNPKQVYPPLPPPPMPVIMEPTKGSKPEPPPPTPDDMRLVKSGQLSTSDAKLVSVLTAFLLVHPLGANSDYITDYVRSMIPGVHHNTIVTVLQRYPDIFRRKSPGYGSNTDHKWEYITFDAIKNI